MSITEIIALHSGYDSFQSEPEDKKDRVCNVCDSICIPEYNKYGSLNSIQAMGNFKHHYNHYYCPNYDKEWHIKAYKIIKAIENMPSPSVIELMEKDLKQLLKENL